MEVSTPEAKDDLIDISMEENGVTVHVNKGHSTPEKAKPFFNPRMKTCRELILTTVGVLRRSFDVCSPDSQIHCLDAFGASGMAGLQWKSKFGKSCHVTITERDGTCVQSIMGNTVSNGFIPKPFLLEFTRLPGLPLEAQTEKEVCIKQCDVSVMMHMEAFDFIHLDPFGCPMKFLTAAFTNIRNNGIICVVATDLGSLFAKHSKVALRNYAADVVRTEYVQETGARILIGAAVRSAVQCNKGVEVLYTVNRDHFVVVCLRVKRGAVYADSSIRQVKRVFHCQMCGERGVCPQTQHVTEDPYDLIPCCCHKKNPGKTAVQLGPMWCGDLFDVTFVTDMLRVAVWEKLSRTILTLLSTLVFEATCADSVSQHSVCAACVDRILKSGDAPGQSALRSSSRNSVAEGQGTGTEVPPTEALPTCGGSMPQVVNPSTPSASPGRTQVTLDNGSAPKKARLLELTETQTETQTQAETQTQTQRQMQTETRTSQEQDTHLPMFYYDLHKKKLPGLNLPKTVKVIALLQKSGLRASRTHFCTTAVRTNATLSQIQDVLRKNLTS